MMLGFVFLLMMHACAGRERDDEYGKYVCDDPWEDAGKDDDEQPEKAQKRCIDIEIFSQSPADTGEYSFFFTAIEFFLFHAWIISNASDT